MRIGYGFDAHRYANAGQFILVWATIDCKFGIIAHSDGDVLIHAICDALLGALALGDLGMHFPAHDPFFKNLESRIMLKQVVENITAEGWQVANVDSTIVAQEPKMMPYNTTYAPKSAEDMRIALNQVSVKATTTENMGFTGRSEGIAVHAVALLQRLEN